MTRKKVINFHKHGLKRSMERCGIGKKQGFRNMINNAVKYGQNPFDFPVDSQIYKFLKEKEKYKGKRIKTYKGKVFILSKNTNNLITVYEIPEHLKEEYKKYEFKQNIQR